MAVQTSLALDRGPGQAQAPLPCPQAGVTDRQPAEFLDTLPGASFLGRLSRENATHVDRAEDSRSCPEAALGLE